MKDEAGKIINWYEQHAKGNTVNRIEIVGENKTILNEDIVVEKGEQVIGD